jgi:hypothetical protein
VKSAAETLGDYDAVWAAGVETEDRDGYFATLGIEITPRFQIRPCIADIDRPRGRTRFWPNLEPGEPEAGDITNVRVDETDEWSWTFEHLYVPNHLPGLGCNGEHAQEHDEGSDQSGVHAAFLSDGTRKVKPIQQCGRLSAFDFSSIALRDGTIFTEPERASQRADLSEQQALHLVIAGRLRAADCRALDSSTCNQNVTRPLLFRSLTRFQLRNGSSSKLGHKVCSFLR